MAQGAIGIDVGGTKIAIGFVDAQGAIISRRHFATEVKSGPQLITDKIAQAVKQLIGESSGRVEGIGVGMAGQIDSSGQVHFAPNLQWREYPFARVLSDLTGQPVFVTNDVKAAAWGEWLFGAGRGHRDLVCLFVGTGVGGSIISSGKMLEGMTNCAGELGHMVIDLNGPKCHCGGYGCLESLAGGWAIARMGQEWAVKDRHQAKMLLELSQADVTKIDAVIISLAAQKQDPLAMQILSDVSNALIAGVTSIVNGLNPSCVILGGGFIEGNHALIQKIDDGVRARALPMAVRDLKIEKAALGNDAGLIGAASYVLNRG